MSRSRPSILFIILNVIIALGVALGLVTFLNRNSESAAEMIPVTVPILITATPDPDGEATRIAIAVAATVELLESDINATRAAVNLPPEILTDLPPEGAPDGAALPAVDSSAPSLSVPTGCIVHVIESGDTPAALAEQYGVSVFAILLANGMTEDDARFIQIGDEMIIPLPDCPIDELVPPTDVPPPTSEADETDTVAAESDPDATLDPDAATLDPDVTPTPTESPTPTPAVAPTALNAQVRIVEVIAAGDITAEGIRIVNEGSAVNVSGWTLTDAQGNAFTLPEQRLFTNGTVTIYTRPGEDTPIVFYWGRSTAVWGDSGDVATLTDANGQVQSSVRVDEASR
jgi:LysM repeat protein